MTGTVRSGTVPGDPTKNLVAFPPDPGKTTIVEWDTAEVNVEGLEKGKKGQNEGSACVGDVAVNGSVKIVDVA